MKFYLLDVKEEVRVSKVTICIWCKQNIYINEPHTVERSVTFGEFETIHWHSECWEVADVDSCVARRRMHRRPGDE